MNSKDLERSYGEITPSYLHKIVLKKDANNQLCVSIITSSKTAFTAASLLAWLKDCGYKEADSIHSAIPAVGKMQVSSATKGIIGLEMIVGTSPNPDSFKAALHDGSFEAFELAITGGCVDTVKLV